MVAFTSRRAGRTVRVIFVPQSAKGTIENDFTTTGAENLWTEEAEIFPGPEYVEPTEGYASTDEGPAATARRHSKTIRTGYFIAQAASHWLTAIFNAAIGTAVAGLYSTIAKQPPVWYSLAWVEDRISAAGTSTQRLIRLQDVYFYRFEFDIDHKGKTLARVDFAYEIQMPVIQLDDALIGPTVGLPAPPMNPAASLKAIFPGRSVTFVRDPASANETLNFNRLVVTFDNTLGAENFASNRSATHTGWTVWKAGKMQVTVGVDIEIDDDSWDVLDNAITPTRQRFTLTLNPESGGALTVDFYEMDFEFGGYRQVGQTVDPFDAVGRAHVDSSGNFITIQ